MWEIYEDMWKYVRTRTVKLTQRTKSNFLILIQNQNWIFTEIKHQLHCQAIYVFRLPPSIKKITLFSLLIWIRLVTDDPLTQKFHLGFYGTQSAMYEKKKYYQTLFIEPTSLMTPNKLFFHVTHAFRLFLKFRCISEMQVYDWHFGTFDRLWIHIYKST